MKPIILSVSTWRIIRAMLQEEHPKTVFMIRDKMKKVLGFTVREHKRWIGEEEIKGDEYTAGFYRFEIHLDFFSQNKRTMFLMKFSEVIGGHDGKL